MNIPQYRISRKRTLWSPYCCVSSLRRWRNVWALGR